MKKILCFALTALLLCACAPSAEPAVRTDTQKEADRTAEPASPIELPEINGYADFSDVLSAMLIKGDRNANFSPISLYLALAMAADGAQGETQTAMLALLGCESIEELRTVCAAMLESLSFDGEESTLAFADSLWIDDKDGRLTFNDAYLQSLADTYRSEANAVDFGKAETGKQIADWITEHTRGKIEIAEDAMQFDPLTVAVLINTIYLKDVWRDKFSETATEEGTFFGPEGESTVDYMQRRDENVTIIKGDGFLRYSLPLRHIGRMTFVLPDEGTALSELLGSPERLHTLLRDGEESKANVNVKLPKFSFQDRFDLNDALQSAGIGIAFSDNANFRGMGDFDACISKVLQESYIGVDENGVEAAAYTMIALAGMSAMDPEELPEIDFFLTRPFLYAIEAYDGTVLFIGTVTAPTAK